MRFDHHAHPGFPLRAPSLTTQRMELRPRRGGPSLRRILLSKISGPLWADHFRAEGLGELQEPVVGNSVSQLDCYRVSLIWRNRHMSDPQTRFLELDAAYLVLPDIELLHPVEVPNHLGALLGRQVWHELAFDEAG